MAIPFLAVEISGLADPTYASGGANKKYVDAVSGSLSTRISGIPGNVPITWGALSAADGSISIPAGTFQVSSAAGAALTFSVPGYATISANAFNAMTEIGLSGAKYHDMYTYLLASSQKIADDITSGSKYTDAYHWTFYSANRYEDLLASGVKYTDIFKSGTKYTQAYDWFLASSLKLSESGSKYTDAYNWYNLSSGRIGDSLGSGLKYSQAYDWFVASSLKLSESGSKLTNAYNWYVESAQKLSTHAFGWSNVPADNPITHTLGVVPKHISVTPSGNITFGYAIDTVTTTQFTVNITAPGDRMISWRAEV
jgi:hypothetical protein